MVGGDAAESETADARRTKEISWSIGVSLSLDRRIFK
jgi:hypothetical protein